MIKVNNFIHYKRFPSITRDKIKDLNIDGDFMIIYLIKRKRKKSVIIKNLLKNIKKIKNIGSPFKKSYCLMSS